jgi:hypothetical protein
MVRQEIGENNRSHGTPPFRRGKRDKVGGRPEKPGGPNWDSERSVEVRIHFR